MFYFKKIIFLFIILITILSGLVFAQKEESVIPRFDVDITVFPGKIDGKSEVLIFVWVRNTHLQYIKENHSFISEYQLNLSVQDLKGNSILTADETSSIIENKYSATIDAELQKLHLFRLDLAPQEYIFKIRLLDLNTSESRIEEIKKNVPGFEKSKLAISDLLIVKPTDADSIRYVDIISPFRIQIQDKVYIYAEIINPLNIGEFNIEASIIQNGRFKNFSFSDQIAFSHEQRRIKLEVKKENMRKGRNEIIIKIQAGNQISKVTKNVYFYSNEEEVVSTAVDDLIDPLYYIANPDDWKKLNKSEGEERDKVFKEFWDRRDPNPEGPENDLYNEFYRRVALANNKFSHQKTEGWKTDMGRIFIVYGKPDSIERNTPSAYSQANYEVWYYNDLRLKFVFYDEYGFGNFRLISGNFNPPF